MAKTKHTAETEDTVSSLRDLAKVCGVSETKMRAYRQLVGFPVRDDRKYSPEDVLAFLANCATTADDPDSTEPHSEPEDCQPLAVSDSSVEWITLRVPVSAPSGYIASQTSFDAPAVQTRLRDPGQIRGLQHLHAGCRDAHVQLPNGEHVDSRAEVFRWLFGEIDKALDAAV